MKISKGKIILCFFVLCTVVTAKLRVEATGSQLVSEEAAKIKSHGGFRKDEGEQSQKEAEADI